MLICAIIHKIKKPFNESVPPFNVTDCSTINTQQNCLNSKGKTLKEPTSFPARHFPGLGERNSPGTIRSRDIKIPRFRGYINYITTKLALVSK